MYIDPFISVLMYTRHTLYVILRCMLAIGKLYMLEQIIVVWMQGAYAGKIKSCHSYREIFNDY